MIKIEHIALYVKDLELMRMFYETYFSMTSSPMYRNNNTEFSSYFLKLGAASARIELMHRPNVRNCHPDGVDMFGLAHFALSLCSKQNVDDMTEKLRNEGFTILSDPRTTGDGYYESVVADPEGNNIELTI